MPDWFDKIKEIQKQIDEERDRMEEERYPHPTAYEYTLSNKGYKTTAQQN